MTPIFFPRPASYRPLVVLREYWTMTMTLTRLLSFQA